MIEDDRLASIDMHARSMRLAPEKLAEHVLVAVNAALEDFAARSADQAPVPVIDPLALAGQMRELRDEVGERMWVLTNAMRLSADQFRQEADIASDVPVMDFRHTFDEVIGLLETIGGVPDGEADELLGEGTAGRGMVRVISGPGPRLVAVTIDQRAMHTTPELSGYLEQAVNQAMDESAVRLREHRRAAGADPDLIEARIHGLQESGMDHMRSYGEALAAFMSSIRPRAGNDEEKTVHGS
ncbi:YbaB/EbfC family nucleoid-associated protein [Nonomuraea sp. NPDC049400]|uniref:YbaB/EbfC family nucleoid-associated protein n=1 Tax=Nonomuraea sp. NPDC049400 TaxID=3364352 RepID=UPI0037ADE865